MNDLVKNILFWAVAAVILFIVIDAIQERQQDNSQVNFSEFVKRIESKQVDDVVINPNNNVVTGRDISSNREINADIPAGGHEKLNELLLANDISYTGKKREGGGFGTFLLSFGPILLLIAVWIYFMRQMQGGGKGGGAMSFV